MPLTRADYQDIYTDGGALPLEDKDDYGTFCLVDSDKTGVAEAQFRALGTAGFRWLMKDKKRFWKVSLHIEAATEEDYTAFHNRHR
jgi:hypothetical protein